MIRALRAYLPAIAWGAVIFGLSARPNFSPPIEDGFDKVAHFGAYALLGLLLAHAHHRLGWSLLAAVAVGWLYGISDEWHQSFVPGRTPDPADWLADALGVLAAVALHTWIIRRAPGSSSRAPDVQPDSGPS